MEKNSFLFFWGHTGKPDVLGKECLSQWYPRPFKLYGIEFKTAEHWMMFWKAMLFEDALSARMILDAETPKEAKVLGRKVSGYDQKIWDQNKEKIVFDGNLLKFTSHSDLKEFLLSTKDLEIVEASPYDKIWGIGMAASNPKAHDRKSWSGQNLLGEILGEVRTSIRQEGALPHFNSIRRE